MVTIIYHQLPCTSVINRNYPKQAKILNINIHLEKDGTTVALITISDNLILVSKKYRTFISKYTRWRFKN